MEKEIAEKYETCIRFDEGELYQSEEYQKNAVYAERIKEVLLDTCEQAIAPLLEEYTAALYDVFEWEAKHYFTQGYIMR